MALYLCLAREPLEPEDWWDACPVEAESEGLASIGFVLASKRRREAAGKKPGKAVWVRPAEGDRPAVRRTVRLGWSSERKVSDAVA